MREAYKSAEIFAIAEKYNFFSSEIDPKEIPFQNFLDFCNDYENHIVKRDENLIAHLKIKPVLFRTFIPYDQNLAITLSQIVWYYDEIIVADPLKWVLMKDARNEFEMKRDIKYVYEIIQFLRKFQESIEQGFVLLCSDKAFPQFDDDIKQNKSYLELIEDKEVLPHLEKLVNIGIQKLDGININGAVAEYRGIRKMKMIPVKDTSEAYMSFVDSYKKGTPEDLERLGMRDLMEGEIRKSFVYEIGSTMSNVVIAQNFNSYAMFSREIDEILLRKLNVNNNKADFNGTAYKVTLPVVSGIPTERLMELRMKMPAIFEDFRYHMAELILKIQKEENGNQEVVNYRVKSEINKQLKEFEKEQKIALTKTRVIRIGTPILAGTLAVQSFGLDINVLMTLISGGAVSVTELNTLYNYIKNKEEAKANSLYYLWKVNRKK